MVRRTPEVPAKFGQLAWGYGLEFRCMGCTRAAGFDRADLLQKWGEEGRVAEIATKFACVNCKAKRRDKLPGVRVRIFRTHAIKVRDRHSTPIDKLAAEIAQLKPSGKVT